MSKMHSYRVMLNGEHVNTVFHASPNMDLVREGLVNHDGMDAAIKLERDRDVYDVLEFRGMSHHDGKECIASYEHRNALKRNYTKPFGRAIRAMLEGWSNYAKAHKDRYEDSIGTDYVLGDHWAAIGMSINKLLDGELGGWDAGSINSNILDLLQHEGFDPETGEHKQA